MPSRPPDETDTLAPDQALDSAVEHETMLFYRPRTNPGTARSFVVETLTQWGWTERLDDIRLCTPSSPPTLSCTEPPADGQVLVRVELHATVLRIEVHDGGNGIPARREPRGTTDGGRGLQQVSAVADHSGVEERHAPGKCVWAAFHHSAVPAW
ncbi:ATP-binding protein [Streptomyces odontomachi]|uniref:ATP-binding protein n=1 Tax=Streptomyces odontomachi TaxID=2944940 RepID=UPI00210D199B|nr:ATP-binding protein [Streptomyces sp. ODS25]